MVFGKTDIGQYGFWPRREPQSLPPQLHGLKVNAEEHLHGLQGHTEK
jgi:hypothetical protein